MCSEGGDEEEEIIVDADLTSPLFVIAERGILF
jgi:hypothetical protein